MGKASGSAAAALLLVFALFFVGVPAIAAASQTTTDGVCGPGGTAQTILDQHLDAEQMANAAAIVSVVQQRQLPTQAAVIALATANQETKFVNYLHPTDPPPASGCLPRCRFTTPPPSRLIPPKPPARSSTG